MSDLTVTVMTWTTVLAMVRVVLNGLETFAIRDEYRNSGSYSWSIRSVRYSWTARSPFAAPLNFLLGYPGYIWLIGLQFGCALLLLSSLATRRSNILLLITIVAAIELLSSLRNGAYGTEGSDLIHLVVLSSITVYYAASDPLGRIVVVWFIALQAMLAYFTSGVVKLQSRTWRQGVAIQSVLSTQNYGSGVFDKLFIKSPSFPKFLCWSVIVFECSFPLVAVSGPVLSFMLLLCGVFFHFMIAATMGLNGFFWSFVSTYPAIYQFSCNFHNLMRSHQIL